MKRFLIFAIALIFCTMPSFGWGRVGHATIAKIAEDNLTPKAKRLISEYLNGESIVAHASYADDFKGKLLVDMGFDPIDAKRVNTYPHTFESNEDMEPFRGINDNGRYVKNCIHFIEKMAKELEDHKNLSDSLRFNHIVLLVHFVGDMHCPEHIRYYPDDMSIGKYNITFNGNATTMHKLWDTQIIVAMHPWGYSDIAELLDRSSKKEIKEITAGGPYDWAADCAKVSKPIHAVPEGAKLNYRYAAENRKVMESQLRKAGYRLAKILNDSLK